MAGQGGATSCEPESKKSTNPDLNEA
jgi:hypothetical protein